MKRVIRTNAAPTPRGAYSQGVLASGRLLYVAAQGPFDPASGAVVGESFEEQARQVFANIRAIVEAAGGTLHDVVQVTVYLDDWGDFPAMNAIYSDFFPEPHPARTPAYGVPPGVRIIADAVAVLEQE